MEFKRLKPPVFLLVIHRTNKQTVGNTQIGSITDNFWNYTICIRKSPFVWNTSDLKAESTPHGVCKL